MLHLSNEARTIKTQKCITALFDFNHSSAVARTFVETERRLVICIDFTVALVLWLCVGAIGEGDVLVYFLVNFDRFEKVTVFFLSCVMCICIVDI